LHTAKIQATSAEYRRIETWPTSKIIVIIIGAIKRGSSREAGDFGRAKEGEVAAIFAPDPETTILGLETFINAAPSDKINS